MAEIADNPVCESVLKVLLATVLSVPSHAKPMAALQCFVGSSSLFLIEALGVPRFWLPMNFPEGHARSSQVSDHVS